MTHLDVNFGLVKRHRPNSSRRCRVCCNVQVRVDIGMGGNRRKRSKQMGYVERLSGGSSRVEIVARLPAPLSIGLPTTMTLPYVRSYLSTDYSDKAK